MGNTMDGAAAAATAPVTSWVPQFVPLQPKSSLVIVDLETTGFGAQAEIVQVCMSNEGERIAE